MYNTYGKRFVDIIASAAALSLLSPILLITAALVQFNLGSPIFFRQERPGKNGRVFPIQKFRTMTDKRNEAGKLLSDAERLPPFGKFLRSTSLDELPELWNVLKGEMSLVGPRPLRVEYLPLYTAEQARRHDVRPGITGWAQVNGRNTLSWEERFRMDVWYVENQSFTLDMKIIALTLVTVFRRQGVCEEGQATVQSFSGRVREAKK